MYYTIIYCSKIYSIAYVIYIQLNTIHIYVYTHH